MPDILHRVGIVAPAEAVYKALTTVEGLAGWWTEDVSGDGTLHFQFGERGFFDMKVRDLAPARRVVWDVLDGPPEWIGTTIDWRLVQEDAYCIILFTHAGWREPVEFMHHCSTKWAVFLLSLKQLIETGTGAPSPRDVKIDNWN